MDVSFSDEDGSFNSKFIGVTYFPSAITTARLILFSNSLTFPGQLYAVKASTACGVNPFNDFFCSSANFVKNVRANSVISEPRSLRAGTTIVTTHSCNTVLPEPPLHDAF